ncbi:MAG: hypothetical protein R3D62_18400 [Xanthobacteraceae bacterium]
MVDDKQRPGESEGDTPERAPETGSGESESSSTVDEAAGVEGAGAAIPPGEPAVAEAGSGPEPEEQPPSAQPDAEEPPALPPPAPPAVRRRTSWGAMLLSGIIGGAIVAGAAAYGYLYYLPNNDSAINVLFARLGAAELALRDLSAQKTEPAAPPQAAAAAQEAMTKLGDRLAKVEASLSAAATAAAAATDSSKPVSSEAGATEQIAATKALSDDVARINKRMEETAAALQQARESAEAAMRAAEARPSAAPAGIGKAEFEGLGERVAGLQRSMASLQQALQRQTTETSREDRGVRLAVVAAGLRGAVERGAPFASELEAAKALMADPQAVALLAPFAATGVPSEMALGQELVALAPSLGKSVQADSGADQGFWQRLQSEAEKLVRVRPVNEAPGSNLSAAVARIEAMGKRGDIAGALAELQKLPEAARAPAEPWIKKAQAREAAIAAARRIEAAAVAALANQP